MQLQHNFSFEEQKWLEKSTLSLPQTSSSITGLPRSSLAEEYNIEADSHTSQEGKIAHIFKGIFIFSIENRDVYSLAGVVTEV